jgi:hypothetical protein
MEVAVAVSLTTKESLPDPPVKLGTPEKVNAPFTFPAFVAVILKVFVPLVSASVVIELPIKAWTFEKATVPVPVLFEVRVNVLGVE